MVFDVDYEIFSRELRVPEYNADIAQYRPGSTAAHVRTTGHVLGQCYFCVESTQETSDTIVDIN